MSAPHLPNKTCRVDTYYRLQNIRWILLFALLAFIAGVSAALITTVWFLPSNFSNTLLITDRGNSSHNVLARADQSLVFQVRQRLLTIYDIKQKVKGFYPAEAFVSQAAIISSDGWAVAVVPNFRMGQEKNWEIFNNNNGVEVLEKTLYDKNNQLLYFKIKNQGLRLMSFANWQEVYLGTDLWSVGFGEWQPRFIKDFKDLSNSKELSLDQAQYAFVLNENTNVGQMLLNNLGDLVGFVGANNLIVNGWIIEQQLPSLLSGNKLTEPSLPYSGYFVYGFAGTSEMKSVSGFYVSRSIEKASSSTLAIGDVVLQVQNQALDHYQFTKQIWLAPETINLKVWREGKEVEINLKK